MGLAAEWGPIPGVMSLSRSGLILAVSGGGDEDGNSELHLFSIPKGSTAVSLDDAVRHPVNGRFVAIDWSPYGNSILGLVADATGIRMDMFDLSANEWSSVVSPGIEMDDPAAMPSIHRPWTLVRIAPRMYRR